MPRALAVTLALVCWFSFSVLAVSADDFLYGPVTRPGPATNATASYLGATGLLITPTAMIAAPLKVSGYWHQIRSDLDQRFYGATLGLPGNLEVSGVRLTNVEPLPGQTTPTRDETVVNAKYQVPLGNLLTDPLLPKVAVGVFDASDKVNRTYYVTVSRSLSLTQSNNAAINLHAGWGHPNVSDTRLDGFFGGLDFSPFAAVLVQVEYDAKDLNANLRYQAAPWLSLDAGVVANDLAFGATLRGDW